MPLSARECNKRIEDFREFLEKEIENTQPNPVIGDDDSIFLTDEQEGYKKAMTYALQVFNKKIPKE